MNNKLSVELIPSSAWQNNLRSLLKPSMWESIRKKVFTKNDFKCAICSRPSKSLHAHEVWSFDNINKIQKLENIIALCYLCHGVKHFGYTSLKNNNPEKFIKHFMKINKCDRITFQNHLKEETEKFENRSHFDWQLDLSKLKSFGN